MSNLLVEGTKMDPKAAPKNSRVAATDVMDAYD